MPPTRSPNRSLARNALPFRLGCVPQLMQATMPDCATAETVNLKFGDEAVHLKRDLDDGGLRSGRLRKAGMLGRQHGRRKITQPSIVDEIFLWRAFNLAWRELPHAQALCNHLVYNDVPGGPAFEFHDGNSHPRPSPDQQLRAATLAT